MSLGQARYLKTSLVACNEDLETVINGWLYDNKNKTVIDIKFSGESALIIYENDAPYLNDFFKGEGSK